MYPGIVLIVFRWNRQHSKGGKNQKTAENINVLVLEGTRVGQCSLCLGFVLEWEIIVHDDDVTLLALCIEKPEGSSFSKNLTILWQNHFTLWLFRHAWAMSGLWRWTLSPVVILPVGKRAVRRLWAALLLKPGYWRVRYAERHRTSLWTEIITENI